MTAPSGVPIIGSEDLAANRPAAGDVPDGYVFLATDTGDYSVQSGGAWFTIAGGGGGGSTAREQLSGNAVTIPASSNSLLTFDNALSGDTLVDLTDPSNPAIIDTGVYVVALYVSPDAPMTAGDAFQAILALDAAGENAQIAGANTAGTVTTFPYQPLTLAYYIPAGGTITANVFNLSAVTTYDFSIPGCVIQRIS